MRRKKRIISPIGSSVDMEIMSNSTLLLKKIANKEDVVCPNCGKGQIKPFNQKSEINHYYICNECGYTIILTPSVVVE